MINFFIISKNGLNNNYMVHSLCENIIIMYAYKYKSEAKKQVVKLNIEANKEMQLAINKGLKLRCKYPQTLMN
tara:strand:- start:302 stop:520 length:219 start_codon:yes stop_codon:yes gene_type:complete